MPAKARAHRGEPVLASDTGPLTAGPRSVVIANCHSRLRLDRRAVARIVQLLDAEFPKSKSKIEDGELSLVFLTDAELAQLHSKFLGDPTPTDVITFPGDPALGFAGEICVSVDAALRQIASSPRRVLAKSGRTPALRAFSTELTLYLVHGWLHLAGHDDVVPEKKRAMRRAEARAMRLLNRSGAVPRFTLRGARDGTSPL